ISDALESLKISENFEYTQTAREFGVDRTTLSKRQRGLTGSQEDKAANAQLLNPIQEAVLVKYIQGLSKRGLPPTQAIVRNFAWEIAKKQVGKCWVGRFLKRHKMDLDSRWVNPLDHSRDKVDSNFKYSLYLSCYVAR